MLVAGGANFVLTPLAHVLSVEELELLHTQDTAVVCLLGLKRNKTAMQ